MSCGYNPEEYGAQCYRCPLRKDEAAGPVAPEYHETAEFIVVGDAPEDAEITEGRPFVGPDNYILTKTLAQVGVKRQHAHWTLAVLCQPPNNDMKRYLAKIQSRNSAIKRENATREEQGLDPLPLIPTPQECCRPRLAYEVKLHKNILTLGGSALRAVTGATASILELRGGTMHGPLTYDEGTNTLRLLKNDTIHEDVSPDAVKCLPTVSPTFTRFAKKWTEPFKVDLARAVRWFRGQNDWKPPEIVYQPDAETLREFLATLDFPTYDLETDGIEPTAAKIRCIGIGSAEKVHLVGLLSKDGATRFYSPMEELRILAVLRDVFRDPTRYKVGHNSGSYDRICVRHQWHKIAWELIEGMLNEVAFLHGGESDAYREAEAQIREIWPDDRDTLVDVWPNLDTILLHRLVASELPHRLSFVGSMYTNAPSWKTDRQGRKIAFDAESDAQLHEYCGLDVSQTATVMPILYDLTHKAGQDHLIEDDHQIQEICTAMHQAGMYIDQPLRAKYEKEQLKEIVALRDTLRRAAGNPSLNPGSTHQLRRLLYEEWKLKPILDDKLAYTLSGDPSTADPAIRGCLALRSLPENQIIFLKALRNYRAVQKKLGTYTAKLRPQSEDITGMGWDADELAEEFGFDVSEKTLEGADFFEAASRLFEDKEYSRKGIVWPDGRMRPGYNAHVATCVTPDTWVLGENGLFQVASLVPLYGPPQTEVPASNLVLHDGNTFHPVSHLQNPGICSTKTARLSLGITLTGTPHHRIRVAATPKFSWQDSAGKWHPSEPESIWRRLDALSTADYVLVPFGMDVWAKKAASLPAFTVPTQRTNAHLIQPPTTATEDLAYFVGVYNADGSLHDANGSFAIRLSDTRGRYTEVLLPILRRLFGDLPVRSTPGEGVAITGIALADWAEAIGLRRKITNKSIPPWLLACPRSYAEAYLRGLSRDAFVGVNGGTTVYWRYTGTEQLCREVQMLLLNMGVVGGLKDARTARSPNTWCLFVTGQEDIGQLSTILGFQIPATEEGDTSQRRPKYIRRGNHLWLRVLSAEDGGEQQVYDVTIPETHQFWANGTVSHNTGRLSSSKPMNAQNFPKDLRKLIRAQPGHLLVGADADQLELRIAAARWACPLYLGAFAADADPHSMTAAGVFGDDFLNAPGWPEGDRILVNGFRVPRNGAKFASGSLAERCRKLAKIVQYLSQYGGSPEAGLQALQQTEDDKGELIYLHFQLRQYRQMHQSWLQSAKEFPLGWQKEVAFFRKYGFIQEPVARRRRLMADGEDFNAIVNFPIQGAASSLMNRAMIAIYKEIPLHKWGPGTGIITMTHDALVVECPDDGVEITQDAKGKYHYKVSPGSPAAFVASVIESAMNQKDASLPGVSFTASADFAMTWDKVG